MGDWTDWTLGSSRSWPNLQSCGMTKVSMKALMELWKSSWSVSLPPQSCVAAVILVGILMGSYSERAVSQSDVSAGDPEHLDPVIRRTKHHDRIQSSLAEQYSQLFRQMSPAAKRGYQNLVESPYLPSDFDERVLDELDKLDHPWPMQDVPLPEDRRRATWMAHGLAPRPDDPSKPLQYVVMRDGRYVMNCFACHGGNLYGTTYPGSPNTMYGLQSLTENVRKTKIRLGKKLTHMDIGSLGMPLGTSNGTSNAVMFGVALMNFRDAELNVHQNRLPAPMTNHDMDAPPWWLFHRKHHIYIDGFAEKGHRGLMQFMLVRENGPAQFQGWEQDFEDVYTYLSELRAPKYPLPVDASQVIKGGLVFSDHCAHCHGMGGDEAPNSQLASYPERMVPIEEVQTDRVRFEALTSRHRRAYGQSWFADFGNQTTYEEVDGYVAPPLDGIWASAPYLHNGSVPTLWHLLHPDSRPKVWRRIAMALDEERIGLVVEEIDHVPPKLSPAERRWYFDTSVTGKSASGHDFPNQLSETEKSDLLEYLKTL